MKLKIIGHRGAAGIALENTLPSIQAALECGVYAIEIDVHLTSDGVVVVSHDPSLNRAGGGDVIIAQTTLKELKLARLSNKEPVPTLSEVLALVGSTPLIIEIKVANAVEHVLDVIDTFPASQAIIASPIYSEITRLKELRQEIKGYIRVVAHPVDGLLTALAMGADGVDMNFWLLNPLSYYMAKRRHLDIMVYTINRRFLVQFVHKLYPEVMICTNNPHFFKQRVKRGLRRSKS